MSSIESDDERDGSQDDAAAQPQAGIESYIRRNPTVAVFAALVTGILVGRLGIL